MRVLGILACTMSLVACGADDDSNGAGGGGSSNIGTTGAVSHDCGATARLSGGLVWEISGYPACSAGGLAASVISLKGAGMELFKKGAVSLNLEFSSAPSADTRGPVALETVTIRDVGPDPVDEKTQAQVDEWRFDSGACTLDIQGTSKDDHFDWLWFKARGNCSGSAGPVAPNAKAPVVLGPFEVNAFVSLPH